ncbi:hypothetical protein [Flavobacterium adhaerens]|uniref:hypothetical protein n=1 Tax=Flavobacterium adhaerens TaxID=3149043 RepID=UPI0032B4E6FE
MRSIGLALLAISGSILAAPVALPVGVVTVAGYVAVAGGVISAVSQVTVDTSADSSSTALGVTDDNQENNLNKARDGIE